MSRLVNRRLVPEIIYVLGPEGSYSELAAEKFLEDNKMNCKIERLTPINRSEGIVQEVLRAHDSGINAVGLVPIYNTIEGRVKDTIGLRHGLVRYPKVQIQNEIIMKISHCLAAKKKDAKITRVFSHRQAVLQCIDYITRKGYSYDESARSTADAAKFVSESSSDDIAAICSEKAARIYKLEIVEGNIQDRVEDVYENRTVFVVIGLNNDSPPTGYDKTTITLEVRDSSSSGSLVKILEIFARANINLSHVEAMEKGSLTDYLIWLNVDEHRERMTEVLAEVGRFTTQLTIHGSYPRHLPRTNSKTGS